MTEFDDIPKDDREEFLLYIFSNGQNTFIDGDGNCSFNTADYMHFKFIQGQPEYELWFNRSLPRQSEQETRQMWKEHAAKRLKPPLD